MDRDYTIMTDASAENVGSFLGKLGFRLELSINRAGGIDSYLGRRGVNILITKPRREDLAEYQHKFHEHKLFIPVPETVITADPMDMFKDRRAYLGKSDAEKRMAEAITRAPMKALDKMIRNAGIRSHLFATVGERHPNEFVIIARSYEDVN